MLKKVAVFVSGGGSNLQSLLDTTQNTYQVSLVISDKADAFGLQRAEQHGIKNLHIGKTNYQNATERTEKTLQLLKEHDIDFIVLAGYLAIIPPEMIQEYPQKMLNIHPSLIPSFCGMGFYGHHVHDAVLKAGVKVSGATVHFVDEGVDTGKIIMQKAVDISDLTTADEIAKAVLAVEHEILPKALLSICESKI
ncbi:MAG: phosphoribosylglycinamide formyltransferase [Bacillota bacterium]